MNEKLGELTRTMSQESEKTSQTMERVLAAADQSRVYTPPVSSGEYTVKSNIQGQLEFVEDIDCSMWYGKDQGPINYKAAFIPSALRITIRMVDEEGRNPKTMQQEIWLRRKAK